MPTLVVPSGTGSSGSPSAFRGTSPAGQTIPQAPPRPSVMPTGDGDPRLWYNGGFVGFGNREGSRVVVRTAPPEPPSPPTQPPSLPGPPGAGPFFFGDIFPYAPAVKLILKGITSFHNEPTAFKIPFVLSPQASPAAVAALAEFRRHEQAISTAQTHIQTELAGGVGGNIVGGVQSLRAGLGIGVIVQAAGILFNTYQTERKVESLAAQIAELQARQVALLSIIGPELLSRERYELSDGSAGEVDTSTSVLTVGPVDPLTRPRSDARAALCAGQVGRRGSTGFAIF
jgi:hypothetical protein